MGKCLKKLHEMTPRNTLVDGAGLKRCRACRRKSLEDHRRRKRYRTRKPTFSGKCSRGLHAWVEENQYMEADGLVRCRPCRVEAMRAYRRRAVILRCVVKGCRSHTSRLSEGTYICRKHRENPPSWIAVAGLVVVGTSVVYSGARPANETAQ